MADSHWPGFSDIDPDELYRLIERQMREAIARQIEYFAHIARPSLLSYADAPVVERDEEQATDQIDGMEE